MTAVWSCWPTISRVQNTAAAITYRQVMKRRRATIAVIIGVPEKASWIWASIQSFQCLNCRELAVEPQLFVKQLSDTPISVFQILPVATDQFFFDSNSNTAPKSIFPIHDRLSAILTQYSPWQQLLTEDQGNRKKWGRKASQTWKYWNPRAHRMDRRRGDVLRNT